MITDEELKQVLGGRPQSPGWAVAFAAELQMADETKAVTHLSFSNPLRQTIRRVIWWAKSTPTAEVEKRIMEAL